MGLMTLSVVILGGIDSILGALLAGLLAAVFGLVFGLPALRLKGLYLVVATFAALTSQVAYGLAIIIFIMLAPHGLIYLWERFKVYYPAMAFLLLEPDPERPSRRLDSSLRRGYNVRPEA